MPDHTCQLEHTGFQILFISEIEFHRRFLNYSFVEQPSMTWFEAKDHCEGESGKLVEIDSEEENTALVDEINRRGYDNNDKL